jgi:rhamnosyltransferase
MGHALSEAPPLKIFGTSFFHYSPLRRFYFFRNTLLICRQNYVSNAWRLRLLGGLFIRLFVCLLIDKKKTSSLHMMLKGIYQGLLNQSGEYKK